MIITHNTSFKDDRHLNDYPWSLTISNTKRLYRVTRWCYENYDIEPKIYYYQHGTDKWTHVKFIANPDISVPNNHNDYLRIYFKDEADIVAFKLAWME